MCDPIGLEEISWLSINSLINGEPTVAPGVVCNVGNTACLLASWEILRCSELSTAVFSIASTTLNILLAAAAAIASMLLWLVSCRTSPEQDVDYPSAELDCELESKWTLFCATTDVCSGTIAV